MMRTPQEYAQFIMDGTVTIGEHGQQMILRKAVQKGYLHSEDDAVSLIEAVVELRDREHASTVERLRQTWLTLVTYRDLALDANDFDRAVGFSHVLGDIAEMILSTGATLPEIPRG